MRNFHSSLLSVILKTGENSQPTTDLNNAACDSPNESPINPSRHPSPDHSEKKSNGQNLAETKLSDYPERSHAAANKASRHAGTISDFPRQAYRLGKADASPPQFKRTENGSISIYIAFLLCPGHGVLEKTRIYTSRS